MSTFRASAVLVAAVAALAALLPGDAAAQEPVTFGGQVRPRIESRDPASTGVGRGQTFTSMRTRLSVAAALPGDVRAFVQLQDVRFFGEETSTLADFSADALDVHQAWIELGADADPLGLRVGRQEVSLGGERLVGAVGWTQQGRSFDGARLRIGEQGARARVDVIGFQIAESAAPATGSGGDAAFLGAYATLAAGGAGTVELYALHDRAEAGDADTRQTTAGARWVASSHGVDWRAEGAWQTGERAGADVAGAWFVGLRAGTALAGGDARVTLWFDLLSGDGPDAADGEVGAFSTLYATNHKFYGFADLFLDIPVHTAGRGLSDLALETSWAPAPGWTAGVDLHRFAVAEDDGLDSGWLADEIDLTVGRALTSAARVTGGISWVREGDALGPVRGIGEDVTFGYLMLDVVF